MDESIIEDKGGMNLNSIGIDFSNKMVCIMNSGQQGTQIVPAVKIEDFYDYIPEKYRDNTSFTWNFEDSTFTINEDYLLHPEAIMTKECFIPTVIIPMPGLGDNYKEFVARMGFEEVKIEGELTFSSLVGIMDFWGSLFEE